MGEVATMLVIGPVSFLDCSPCLYCFIHMYLCCVAIVAFQYDVVPTVGLSVVVIKHAIAATCWYSCFGQNNSCCGSGIWA